MSCTVDGRKVIVQDFVVRLTDPYYMNVTYITWNNDESKRESERKTNGTS